MYENVNWFSTLENVVLTILWIVIIVIFAGAIYAFLMSIFQLIFSRWEAEKVKKAWNNIRYMILWVVLSIILLFVAPIIFERFQIPWYKVYTAQNIFKKATQLLKILKDPNWANNQYYPTDTNNNIINEERLEL